MKDKILCITYWDNRAYTKLWERLPEVKFYGWWDNTDEDENCTKKEWKQRGKDWNSFLTGAGIPAQCGFSFTLLDYTLPFKSEYK